MTGHRMAARPGGGFTHQEKLATGGRYHYYYEIDGAIHKDCGADEYVVDGAGWPFSVVAVPPVRIESP